MLQANEIQQRYSHLQQTLGEAEQACMASQDTPPEMRDCIQRISRELKQAQDVMQSNDERGSSSASTAWKTWATRPSA
ncbi:hypothetical protein [Massilia haematophila]|uniref:Uncharacterized protein n=1 Tax=Massilia haematophila TaxID=457923 RepID=A0ABV7PU86_9BURK